MWGMSVAFSFDVGRKNNVGLLRKNNVGLLILNCFLLSNFYSVQEHSHRLAGILFPPKGCSRNCVFLSGQIPTTREL